MLMISRNIFTHDVSFHCCQGQRHRNACAGLNATCASVTSIRETKGSIYFCNLGGGNFLPVLIVNVERIPYNINDKFVER